MNFKKIGTATAVIAGATLLLTSCAIGGVSDKPGKNVNKPTKEPASIVGIWEQIDPDTGKPSASLRGNLTFEKPNGKVSGSDGCNNIFGDFSTKGTEIKFDGLASTQMYCEGVDDVLSSAVKANFTSDTMTVQDGKGKDIATLKKVEKLSEVPVAEIPKDTPSNVKDVNEQAPVKQKNPEDMTYEELEEAGIISTTGEEVTAPAPPAAAPTPDPNALGPGAVTI